MHQIGYDYDDRGNLLRINAEPTAGGGSSTTMKFYEQGNFSTPAAQRTKYLDGFMNQPVTRQCLWRS